MGDFESNLQTLLSTAKDGKSDELNEELLELKCLNEGDTRNNCLALINAIETNNIEDIKLLLNDGATVNGSDFKEPLHFAVKHNHLDIVKILLEHKADVNAKDSNGQTSLQIALQNKFYKIADLLLEFKAVLYIEDSECYNSIFQIFSDYPATGKIIDAMFVACQENIANSTDEDGLSLLHIACTRSNIDIIDKLLLTTSDVNAFVHEKLSKWAGYTALHFAASAQNVNTIHLLLKHQADVGVVEARGLTPLWLSLDAQPKYTKIENMINGKFGNKLENMNEGEIINSLSNDLEHVKVAELLVKNNSNLNHRNNVDQPLLIGAYQSFVNSFVTKHQDSEGIISRICNIYYQKSASKIMSFLIEPGVDLNACDRQKNHILHYIVLSPRNSQYIDLAIEVAEIILKNGANVNAYNKYGFTPLYIAIQYGCLKFVELFLKFDADVDATDKIHLSTYLHIAVYAIIYKMVNRNNQTTHDVSDREDSLKVLECLLKSNCNVNAQDVNGKTPLFIAAMYKDVDCVKLLLHYGADINIKDCSNTSMLEKVSSEFDYTLSQDDLKILKVLVWHALKLLMIGHPVDPSNLLRCERSGSRFVFHYRETRICEEKYSDSIVSTKYTACLRDELEELKGKKIDSYTSLRDILRSNVQQMTKHVKNKTFEEYACSENLCTRFPHYGYLLSLKFKGGLARNAILEEAIESLQHLTHVSLTNSCIDNIFSYMTDKDLNNLVLATQ